MQLKCTSRGSKIPIKCGGITRIAVKNVRMQPSLPYCNEDERAITGAESFVLPRCETREDFVHAVSKCKLVDISLQEGYFSAQPRFNETGITGLYQNANKSLVLLNDNGSYSVQDYLDTGLLNAQTICFGGGNFYSASRDFSISGQAAYTSVGESPALTIANDISISEKGIQIFEKTEFQYRAAREKNDQIRFYKNGRVSAELLTENEIRVPVDQILELPFYGVAGDYILKSNTDNAQLKDLVRFGFAIRGGTAIQTRNLELIADMPLDTQELRFRKNTAGKIEVYSSTENVQTLVFRSLFPCEGDFCVMADDTYMNMCTTVQKSDTTNRDGSLVFAIQSIASDDYTIMTSPKFEISVVAGVLRVNGEDSVTIPQQKVLIIAIEKDANLVIDLFNITDQTYVSSAATSVVWTDTTALSAPIVWKAAQVLGPWIQTSITQTDRAIQWVKAEILGSPATSVLGTYATPNFGSGATLEGYVLTIAGETFTKVQIKLSSQMQKILRMRSPVTTQVTGDSPAYETRIDRVEIHASNIKGVNGTSLMCAIQPNTQQSDPVFHELTRDSVELTYRLIDNQGDGTTSTKLTANQKWSVMLVTM